MRVPIFIFLILLANSALAQNGNEKNLFSFLTADEEELTLTLDTSENVMIYRFRDNESPEIEVRDNLNDSIFVFKYSYYFRGGGTENAGLDLNYVSFIKGYYKYKIYYEYAAEGNSTSIGIIVLNTNSNEEHEFPGLIETMSGSLIDFRFNNIIPIEED